MQSDGCWMSLRCNYVVMLRSMRCCQSADSWWYLEFILKFARFGIFHWSIDKLFTIPITPWYNSSTPSLEHPPFILSSTHHHLITPLHHITIGDDNSRAFKPSAVTSCLFGRGASFWKIFPAGWNHRRYLRYRLHFVVINWDRLKGWNWCLNDACKAFEWICFQIAV